MKQRCKEVNSRILDHPHTRRLQLLQFAHAFSVSGMHNERNTTSECTTFILSSCRGNEVGQAKKPDNSL